MVGTIVDRSRAYSVTGAPQIAGPVVVIGNGGAEYDSRGYASAYDLDTGALVWRFFTVPGDPAKPQESAALERAAKTWSGEWWKTGGGGIWQTGSFDPETHNYIVGTGNPFPIYDPQFRPGAPTPATTLPST